MILSIVFLQDSKEGGLGGAFGSAGGGDSVLGASGQKGIVKVTAVMSIIFFVLIIGWGVMGSSGPGASNSETQKIIDGSTKSSEAGTGSSEAGPAAPAGGAAGPVLVPTTDGKTGGGESSDGSGK